MHAPRRPTTPRGARLSLMHDSAQPGAGLLPALRALGGWRPSVPGLRPSLSSFGPLGLGSRYDATGSLRTQALHGRSERRPGPEAARFENPRSIIVRSTTFTRRKRGPGWPNNFSRHLGVLGAACSCNFGQSPEGVTSITAITSIICVSPAGGRAFLRPSCNSVEECSMMKA